MFTKTEQVWRHLIDGAHHGQRRWKSVTWLADDLGIPVSTVHRALTEPRDIGAVLFSAGSTIRVINPGKLLMLWAGKRDLKADMVRSFIVPASANTIELAIGNPNAVLGGCGAVVSRLRQNTIADYSSVLVYGEPDLPDLHPAGERFCEVVVLRPDSLLSRYGSATTLGQAWVDLFRRPDWQAAQFVHDLLPLLTREDQDAVLPA